VIVGSGSGSGEGGGGGNGGGGGGGGCIDRAALRGFIPSRIAVDAVYHRFSTR